MKIMKYAIFTKPIHVEKIVNYLNQNTDLNYIISTERSEPYAYDFDIGVSYCFPYIIKPDLIKKAVWYNYHPAPLPKYPGLTCCAIPIRKRVMNYGVSLHVMTNEVDKGTILKTKSFPLKSLPTTTNEIGNIAHYYLFQLFKETIHLLQHKPKNAKEMK